MQLGSEIRLLVRFGLVGFITNFIGYIVYLLLTMGFALSPKLIMTLLYILGTVLGFVGNKKFTFGYNGNWKISIRKYLIVYVVGWAGNYFVLHIFVDGYGFPHQLVQAIAIFLFAAFTFIALRLFVFPSIEKGKTT